MSEQDNKLKLLGKLGLDLSRLHTDVQTMENLIKKANGKTGELSKAWQTVAGDMKRAFKDFPLQDYLKALDKLEKAQKAGLAKTAKNSEKEQNAEKRRDEKHHNTMLAQQMLYNAKIEALKERNAQKMAQNDLSYQQKQVRDLEKHQTTMSRLYNKALSTSSFGRRLDSLTDYALASGAIYGSFNAMKQIIDVNKEFEVGQMNLQRVLHATAKEMEQVKKITIDVAKSTGNATKDIQDIENLWIRTGMANLNNLKELTELTAIGLNTAQFKDAEESVSMLVGAVNQMADGDVSKASAILDSWIKVADETAVKNTSDLAEVISRAGSQGRQLGLTFHDLNAMTGILAERMAVSGDRIGTALKSVFSRMQDPNNYKVIEKWGVKVTQIGTDGKETFRNMIDIMNDLNTKFKELRDQDYGTAMAEIQKAMGGTHQRAIVANLITGWDRYETIVKSSLESTGFATEQNTKILKTFDAQLKILKASFVELSLAIGESGLMSGLSGLVKGTTASVNWFNALDPKLKRTVIVALEVATAFGAINVAQKKFTQIGAMEVLYNQINKYIALKKNLVDTAKAEELLNVKVQAGTISAQERALILDVLNGKEKASIVTGQARTVMLEAQTAVTYGATLATTALMSALTIGLPIVIGLISSYSQEKYNLNKSTLEHIKVTQDEIVETDSLIKEYEKLKEKTALTNIEKERMNEIEIRFGEIFPNTIKGIDAQTSAYYNQIDAVKRLNAEKKRALLEEAQLFIEANKSEAEEAQRKINEAEYNKAHAQDKLSYESANGNWGVYHDPTSEAIAEYKLEQEENVRKYKELLEEIKKKQQIIDTINKSMTGDDTTANTPSSSRPSSSGSISFFDPEEFEYQLDYLQHQFSMGQLTKQQYADKLREKLAQYQAQDSSEDKKVWDLEEQIYNLLQPEKASSNWKKDLPEALTNIMDKLDHQSKMNEIDDSQYAIQLQSALDKYRGQLERKAIWGIEEKIYALQNSKTSYKEIDFDSLKNSLTQIGNELSILDRKEKQLQMTNAKGSTFYPLYTQKINNHNKSIKELTALNSEYRGMVIAIDDKLSKLSPKSARYDELVKQLIQDKKKLTDEIQRNTEAIYDNALAIDKINAEMQEMVENNLKRVFEIQKELASTALEERHEQEMQSIKNRMDSEVKAIQSKIDAKQKEIDLLDEQIKKEEYLQDLAELRYELDKVKADTRFAYIDEATGLEVYTFDREKALQIQKDIDKKEQDYTNEQNRKKLEEELKQLQDQQQQVTDHYNELMKQLEEYQKKEKANFDAYWSQRLTSENISMIALRMIQQEGYKKSLEITEMYFADVNAKYIKGKESAYSAGKSITSSLGVGLFEEMDSIIASYKSKLAELTNLSSASPSSSAVASSGNGKPIVTVKAGSADESILRAQYGDSINYDYSGNGYVGVGSDRYATNAMYQSQLSQAGVQAKNAGDLWKYHTGGFVGGKALNPQHEVVAKLLEGEYVTSIPALNKLSFALPHMTYSSIGSKSGDAMASGGQRPIIIQIDKLTPNDFDDFMRTMHPYITAQK